MKIGVLPAPGLGDAAILHIVSHHLTQCGHKVITSTPHRFGKWAEPYQFGKADNCDLLFLQHDNSDQAEKIRQSSSCVYTFFGSYQFSKHGPLKPGRDYVCNLNQTMVENVIQALFFFFQIQASSDNGFSPPEGLVHRRFSKRVAIHTTSGDWKRNWPEKKFLQCAKWLENHGFSPVFLPVFPTLEELLSFLYESGYFLGNDSGPGHLASYLKIPHLIIGREEKHMRHWRPGWGYGQIITPSRWIPNFRGFKLREKKWHSFISTKSVIKLLKNKVLNN